MAPGSHIGTERHVGFLGPGGGLSHPRAGLSHRPGRVPAPGSHPEGCPPEGLNGLGRATGLDIGRVNPPEEEQEQFAGEPTQTRRRLTSPRPDHVVRPGPHELEPRAAQPAREGPGGTSDVAEERDVLGGQVGPRSKAVRPAYVLVMDEILVEVREATHRSEPEEPWRWPRPDGLDKVGKICLRQREPSAFGEASPGARDDEPGGSEKVVLTEGEVSRDVVRRPRMKERQSVWAQVV